MKVHYADRLTSCLSEAPNHRLVALHQVRTVREDLVATLGALQAKEDDSEKLLKVGCYAIHLSIPYPVTHDPPGVLWAHFLTDVLGFKGCHGCYLFHVKKRTH
eukprot:2156383-Pyramimonas_sp.AAC.2